MARRNQSSGGGADELKGILRQAVEHVGSSTAALIVPDKGIALLRSKTQRPSDTQLVARARRQLLSWPRHDVSPLSSISWRPQCDGHSSVQDSLLPLALSGRQDYRRAALFREDWAIPSPIATPDWPQLSGARRSALSRPATML